MLAARRPPGPGLFAGGLPIGNARTDAATYLRDAAARYGDVVHLRLPSGTGYLISHPDDIKRVLVTESGHFIKSRALERTKRVLGNGLLTSEGDFHRRQRRLVQPAFHRERIEAYGTSMASRAARAAEGWRDGTVIDIGEEMMHLTFAIVGETLFGTDVEADAGVVGRAMTELQTLLPLSLAPFSEYFDLVPLPANLRFFKARAQLDAVIYRIIASRRGTGARDDLVSMLLAARDADDGDARMSDRQVRDECATLLLAGHETTAQLLTWTWFLLARNPDAEAALHRELDALGGGRPSTADVPRLVYAARVVLEAMRLYPPAWVIGRRALAPFEVGGYVLPARSIVLVSPFVVHRDARWFADPDRFDPDRWAASDDAQRPKHSYIPFGAGSRVCIGEGFARLEALLVLATIASRRRLDLDRGYVARLNPLITLRPRDRIPMTARARN